VESEISQRGCRTVQPLASDFVITGAVTDYKEVFSPALQIPGLEWIWRGVAVWVTVDVQVFDLATAELKAYEITSTVTGVEIPRAAVWRQPPGHRPGSGQTDRQPHWLEVQEVSTSLSE